MKKNVIPFMIAVSVASMLLGLLGFSPAALAQTRTPFSARIEVDMNPGEIEESAVFIQVPANKRLVVEFVSVSAAVPSNQEVIFTLVADISAFIPVTRQGTFPDSDGRKEIFRASQRVLIFAEPERDVVGIFRRSSRVGQTGNLIATISGFFEDLP